MKTVLNHHHVMDLAQNTASAIQQFAANSRREKVTVHPVPRGGVPVAYMLQGLLPDMITVTSDPANADVFVDDLIDSGATMIRFQEQYPGKPMFSLINKKTENRNDWVVFPWEETQEAGIEDHITRLLQYVGEDSRREGLLETPKRVAKAWKHWCSGYGQDPASLLKTFNDGAEGCDQMVVRKDIPIYSHCEHHLAAIIGKCTIAYIPNGKVVGLSKLDRLANLFARRLQVQERLTNQIADALMDNLQPLGVGVWLSARHLCVESRGVQHVNSETITSALRGVFKTEPSARAEFLALARS